MPRSTLVASAAGSDPRRAAKLPILQLHTMPRALAAILVFLVSTSLVGEKRSWRVEVTTEEPNSVRIFPSVHGFATLDEALDSIDEDQEVRYIPIGAETLYQEMQGDLNSYFEKNHPAKLKAALSSSGNLHNPKLRGLSLVLDDAILSTSYVVELKKLLRRYHHEVRGVSLEKFFISKGANPPVFHVSIWLLVKKCAEQGCTASSGTVSSGAT